MMTLYQIIAILGISFIIAGNLMIYRKKKIRKLYVYPLLIFGGACLEIYSIYIGDIIFIVLQGIFIIAALYGFIKINNLINV